jgi:hypothetical protein
MREVKVSFFIGLLLAGLAVSGQGVSSQYSSRGIGILNYQGLPHNFAMGDIGIGAPSVWNTNIKNPAFLPLNTLTSFQVGLQMDRRSISTGSQSAMSTAGGLQYLNLAFPVINSKWTTSFSLTPYSSVNYNSYTITEVDDIPVLYSYSGSGGLTSFSWLNGFKLSKELFVGVRLSYIFGAIEHRVSHVLVDEEVEDENFGNEYDVIFLDRSAYSDFTLGLAVGYRKEISNKGYLNAGLLIDFSNSFAGERERIYERRNPQTGALVSSFSLGVEPVAFALPGSIGLGFSYQNSKNFMIAADMEFQSWTKTGLDNTQTQFSNAQRIGLGAEWTPNISDVNSYFKRVTYRMGVSQQNLPFDLNERNIRDLGINFGGSFPVGLSSLDFAFRYGMMGTLRNDLIRENYFRIVLGATINERWFVKRRYD